MTETPNERYARARAHVGRRAERMRDYDPKARAAEIRAQIRADLIAAEERRQHTPEEKTA